MHYGLSHWDARTNTYVNNSTKPHVNETGDGQQPKHHGSRSVKIPTDIQQYLTNTSQPNEIFSKLHDSRERRLRLLLRRFTNQIQYGCNNFYCDVSSCLSYRKRRSDIPVRPYTDVAARALAWRHVEEYANSVRSTAIEDGISGINKRKHLKISRGDGLCWNEPVIPWYADATEYLRRRTPVLHQSCSSSRATSRENKSTPSVNTALGSQRFTQPNDSALKVTRDINPADVKGLKQPAYKHIAGAAQEARFTVNSLSTHGTTTSPERETKVDGTAPAPAPEDLPEPPKDTASFSQILYDTAAIKAFDQRPQIERAACTGTLSQKDGDNVSGTIPSKPSTAQGNPDTEKPHFDCSESTYTFRILNKRVISWLVTLVAQHPNDRISFGGEREKKPVSVATLAQQSLHYCLSHPLRLLESAEAWRLESSSDNESRHLAAGVSHIGATRRQAETQAAVHGTGPPTSPLLPSLDDAVMAFDVISCIQPYSRTLDSIFAALQHAYVLPPTLHNQRVAFRCKSLRSPNRTVHYLSDMSTKSPTSAGYLDDQQVASICVISLLSLVNISAKFADELEFPVDEMTIASTYINYLWCREIGQAFPHAYMSESIDRDQNQQWKNTYQAVLMRIDANDDMHVMRLLEGLADVISHRLALHETVKTMKTQVSSLTTKQNIVDSIISLICQFDRPNPSLVMQSAWSLLDLMCVVLSKMWDKRSTIQRRSSVGGALQMLAGLYRNRTKLNIPAHTFTFKFVAEALDATKMPLEWLSFREDTKQTHILSFSFLFDASSLVKYFRAINIEIMRRSFEYASVNNAYAKHFLLHKHIPVYGAKEVLADLRPHMARYFVLTVRRQHLLEDAINQIWRRQHQELMRPLKVSLGKGEGEDGLDHGGVQQEFFRIVFAEALDVVYGMFTTDDRTRMTWFQPGSLEPLYKFEALGVLMSLAVYNSVTLPVTFPLAFYRKLLGLRAKCLEHIEDGWPVLTKGLRTMQNWSDGDVGEVMVRTYEFSYRRFDKDVTIDMSKVGRSDPWPSLQRRRSKDKGKSVTLEQLQPDQDMLSELSEFTKPKRYQPAQSQRSSISMAKPVLDEPLRDPCSMNKSDSHDPSTQTSASEAPLVTNANRDQYIKDYIFWLTHKSIGPQFEAFAKGFHTCLDPVALSIFTPEALKTVVEGHTDIDIEGLEASATYDDYATTDQIIIDFWGIIRDMSPAQHKRLLEFVTASDRVPVNGISSVTFIIQRNGDGDDRLPSSSTCYSRLLLPKYSSKAIMRAKLEKAIENSVGFGSL